MEQKPQIEIRGLCKDYPIPGGEVHALSNISLTIDKGDIYGIIGMSGAGKSTLIRCLNRLDTPTDGQIFIDGENILAMSKQQLRQTRRRMAMIFQQFNLLMQKSVARNVRYPLEIAGVPKKQANERVIELLKIVGLEDKASAYPAQLSGGQKQRVAIARALASDPEMLLCDEATSALDPMTTQSILSLLQKINRELGITVVLITHEMARDPPDLQQGGHSGWRQARRAGHRRRCVHAHQVSRGPQAVWHFARAGGNSPAAGHPHRL